MDLCGPMVEALRARGTVGHARRLLCTERLAKAKGLYKRDLLCHFGCVNAIEFSADGQLLVSGGDDRRVMLWPFGKTLLDKGQPHPMNTQHYSNIFCLAITDDKSRIYSGGNDDQVIVHDTQTRNSIEALPHRMAVCSIAIDPAAPRILATAGNDGRLLVFDTRQSVEESMVVSKSRKAFHAVAFHPQQSGLIVAANARNGAALWDIRKPKHAVIKYGSGNCMSVKFNSTGNQILALRRRLPPILYNINSPEPRVHFYHSDYYNSCTMKSCCFAGDNDQYILSGSDDFNLYMWQIPDCSVETWVDQTHLILYGHRSIVNQVRYNPQFCAIASSGVEKIIKVWSPLQFPGSKGSLLEEQLGPENPRDVYSHEDYVSLVHHSGQYISHNYADQSTSEDPRMMAFFDSLVQREIEGWSAEDTDSLSGDDLVSGLDSHLGSSLRTFRTPPYRSNHTPQTKDSDSSDSDQMLIHLLRKRVPVRNHRYQNRIARIITARSNKLFRVTQKRIPARNSQSCISKRMRAPRPLRARRGLRRGGISPPLPLPSSLSNVAMESPPTDSDADSDVTLSPRSQHRYSSKMVRPNRRRMSMSRTSKRKSKSTNYRTNLRNENGTTSSDMNGNHLNDPDYSDDNLAVPSTSTGIRGHNNSALFRIAKADSDDDQSVGSCPKSPARLSIDNSELPLVNILPTPINGSRENVNSTYRNRMFEYDDIREGYRGEPLQMSNWDRPGHNMVMHYTPTLSRLRNETNESEVESSCSTRSTADDACTPKKVLNPPYLTSDSGIHTGPCTSSGSKGTPQMKKKDELEFSEDLEWMLSRQKQRIKRVRRNYRNHMGDSDST